MKTWTTQAERRLVEYLDGRATREGFAGDEAEEFKADLRCHIHEEAEREPGDSLGLMALEGILQRLDGGYRPAKEARALPTSKWAGFKRFFNWTFGVVFPLGVTVFEIGSGFCGGVFFDPVPTIWHVLLLALVPFGNAYLLIKAGQRAASWVGALTGSVLVTSVFYALLFLPLLPASVIALIAFGLGLLSLTPILAALVSWRLSRHITAEHEKGFRQARKISMILTTLVLVLLEGPGLWTRLNVDLAMGKEPSQKAINRLRAFHSENTLLKTCYEGNRGTQMATDISGWMMQGWRIPVMMFGGGNPQPHDSELARELFFRVTGKGFNTVKPPKSALRDGGRGRGDMEQLQFDDYVGSDQVAVRLKNLDLAESRLDGHFDAASQLGYAEWTMVFANGDPRAREARCQVRLPRDGRVSRLTLWVNGEPREAAFSTVAKVKAAYQEVAVRQSRDPVLVTMCGPDTVMVQCFPVPGNGRMKIRLGITAPLTDSGRWELPKIVEQNFGLQSGLEHSVWLQGDKPFLLEGGLGAPRSNMDGPGQSLSVSLPGTREDEKTMAVRFDGLESPAGVVWCEDPFAKPEERVLSRKPMAGVRKNFGPPVIVVDGSAGLKEAKDWILAGLKSEYADGACTLILADDQARRIELQGLADYRFSGGRDNEAALREAVELAARNEPTSPILWIHGPQAVKLSRPEALLQRMERGSRRPMIMEIEAKSGPNRLAEQIYRSGSLLRGPTLIDPAKDFPAFLKSIRSGEVSMTQWEWSRSAGPEGLTGRKVWDQLARFWAASLPEDKDGIKARYQLVTPTSGAVVLETAEQYQKAGLEPVNPDSVPSIPNIPEPSTWLLIITGSTVALLRRRRVC